MAIALSILLSLLVAWFVLSPFFFTQVGDDNRSWRSSAAVQTALDDKERFLQVLKDLEFDYSSQRVSQDDYDRTRARLMSELATVMEHLEEDSRGRT